MANRKSGRPRKSIWSSTGPTPRLLFGAFAIAAIGLLGLTPKTLFGLSIAWPYAALWGAVGWGRVGMSLRPMVLLIAFGLIQDISFNAPLGCFVIVNLVVYGFSAWIAGMFDVMNEPLVAVIAPVLQFISGFLVLWLMASALEDHAVRATPLFAAFLTTGVIYAACHRLFDLGRAPGESVGQAT
ncbi:hypothetical protein [Hyphomonas chukchiensis]|uniref:Rod shape-determining protein MreD n=1 Tax=Hyphomonas chukchiensis TaxID=1280947 RepID=A0A062UHJ3_9PROT|nr:hypothetical protein [Hyphomonas chukchiensis]KCZ57782.1 hypothetical protein HY30_17085 [Hyphomonas chukchiensis]|tara:strand:- start:4933 stop:5484 length:552 start_codon:yes stop_codon:yes gene_type:complete